MDTDKHYEEGFLPLEETVAKHLLAYHLIGSGDNLDMKRRFLHDTKIPDFRDRR